jgi:hypothetical protein
VTRVLPKILLCLFMFEAVHRRSNSLKTFDLQFRLGSFQMHGPRDTGWKLRQYRCSGLFERWLECDSIRSPGSSEFTFAKGSCARSKPSRPLARFRTTPPRVGINAGEVNGARSLVIALGRVTYVGGNANGNY